MKSNVGVNHGDCKDQWNQIELGLLVMALLVVILTTMCLANEIHWAHSDSWSSLATFTGAHVHHAMLLNIFQISRKVSATNDLHWFHLVSKLAPQNCTTWPSGWGWSPGHVDCGDHRHRGNSRSDDIWWHPPSSVVSAIFIRSPHGPIGLELLTFRGIRKQLGEKNLESWWKLYMKFWKRPDGMLHHL